MRQAAADHSDHDVRIAGLDHASRKRCGFGLNYEFHHGGNSLNNVANLHVFCAIPNTEYFEIVLPDEAQKCGLVDDLSVGRDGFVHVPKKPGLGVEIDFDLIGKSTTRVLS